MVRNKNNDSTGIEELYDYDRLSLIERPVGSMMMMNNNNTNNMQQQPTVVPHRFTLEGCVGHLKCLPLRLPNVDPKRPITVVDMINILTDPDAISQFESASLFPTTYASPGNHGTAGDGRSHSNEYIDGERGRKPIEGMPASLYDYSHDHIQTMLKSASKRTCHMIGPLGRGLIVDPGCISLYMKDGKTYAVNEGRWILTNYKAYWIARNISLDNDEISYDTQDFTTNKSKVLIIRVPPGSIGRVRIQGVEELLDVGMHVFNGISVVNDGTVRYSSATHIKHGRYNYVRVPRGVIAKVWAEVNITNSSNKDGVNYRSVQPRLLDEGEHYIDSHLFQFDGLLDVSSDYIEHGSIHRLCVEKGSVAKIFLDNIPKLLGEGTHIIESTSAFDFIGTENLMTNRCIQHGTITILRVILGEIGIAYKNNEPIFLDKPGLYEFDSPDFRFISFKKASEQLIQLGSKKIILVHSGQVAITYDQGELKVLMNGRHIIDSSTHIFDRFISTQQKSIRLSTLHTNEKLAKELQQQKQQTQKRRRNKDDDDDDSNDNEQIMQNHDDISTIDDPDSDLTLCETKDLVSVGIRADVFYNISDPEKCIQKINPNDIDDFIRETSVATLTNIIRSTTLNEIAAQEHKKQHKQQQQQELISANKNKNKNKKGVQVLQSLSEVNDEDEANSDLDDDDVDFANDDSNKKKKAGGGKEDVDATATTNTTTTIDDDDDDDDKAHKSIFFEKVHDEFISMLHEDFIGRYGIDIANIRIESLKIMDDQLSDQISKYALTTAQIENEMANLDGSSLILTTKEQTAAEVRNIQTQAEVISLKTMTDAENQRKIDTARALAEAHKIETRAKAEAEAEAILMKAKAEAEAIRLKAVAEAERAEILSTTLFGQQVALLTQYSDMVVQSNQGIEKIIYMDPTTVSNNRECSPFALGSIQNLNTDLQSLTQLGTIAAAAISSRDNEPTQQAALSENNVETTTTTTTTSSTSSSSTAAASANVHNNNHYDNPNRRYQNQHQHLHNLPKNGKRLEN